MFDHLKTHTPEGQNEILEIKMAAHVLYERMMIAYWSRDAVNREYHIGLAENEMKKLMEIGARLTEAGDAEKTENTP